MITAIVLAAGRSRRMGTQKLLLPVAGRPMIATVVDQLLQCPVASVLVVVGSDGEPIRQALAGRGVEFIVNDQPESEMLHSVRCGLRAASQATTGALVALGDQPTVAVDTVKALVAAFERLGRGIVVPAYRGRRGHPLLLSSHYFAEVLSSYDQMGLRGLLTTHAHDVTEIEAAAPTILEDIDTPEDYARLTRRAGDDRAR